MHNTLLCEAEFNAIMEPTTGVGFVYLRRHRKEDRGEPYATLFDIPGKMNRVFDRDLTFAGIAKTDPHGRVLDIHSLRHTYATMLARAAVPLQQTQQLLRHSDPKLTAGVYTHLGILDGAAAVAKIPELLPVESEKRLQVAHAETSPAVTTVERTVETGNRGHFLPNRDTATYERSNASANRQIPVNVNVYRGI